MATTTDGIAIGADFSQTSDDRVVYYSANIGKGIYYDIAIDNMDSDGAPQYWYSKTVSGTYSSLSSAYVSKSS